MLGTALGIRRNLKTAQDAPVSRPVQRTGIISSHLILGGLHHHYAPLLSAKRLEILSEIVPGLARVAALWDPTSGNSQVSMTEIAARAKNIQLHVLKVQHRDDLAEAFEAARKAGAQALNIFASPFLSSLSGEIIGVAAAHRLPAIYQWKEHVESGGLVSYGPSLVQLWRQAGIIAAKLSKGAKPADMPVEQPTKFELIVNTRTAKAIGINLSPSLLVRADEVVDSASGRCRLLARSGHGSLDLNVSSWCQVGKNDVRDNPACQSIQITANSRRPPPAFAP